MILRRALSAAPLIGIGAAVLAVGTAAAPDPARHVAAAGAPRLVASPARLAAATAIAPGDRIARPVELRMLGRGAFGAIYFVARAQAGSRLDADRDHGLRIEIRSCPTRWARRGNSYACPAKTTVVLSERPLVGRSKLNGLDLRNRRRAHLALRLSLPADAGNALQGQASAISYAFVGVAGD